MLLPEKRAAGAPRRALPKALLCTVWLVTLTLPAGCLSNRVTEENRLAGLGKLEKLCIPTHLGVFGDVTTVTTYNDGIVFRQGLGAWAKAQVELKGAHSVARLKSGKWLIADTENNRVIQLDDLSGKGALVARSELAGFSLSRPHDEIIDPNTGEAYVIDGNRRLFRFSDLTGQIEVWTFTPEEMGYARALSWFDGHLHVMNSSRGEVFRIDNYLEHRYTVFRSPRPRNIRATPFSSYDDFIGGALDTTGLVLNDVEKSGDWYYATNFFAPTYAFGGDTRPARLIRWRTWSEFERGDWEDLSRLLPEARIPLVPYFITVHKRMLYTAVFNDDESCERDQVVRIALDAIGPDRGRPHALNSVAPGLSLGSSAR